MVFYLTGFCGLNLLKHSCFACHKSDFHLIYDLDHGGNEVHHCKADSHPHIIHFHDNSTHVHYISDPCCALELIYLKNNPKSLLKQVVKSPLISSIDLYILPGLQLYNFTDTSENTNKDCLYKIIDPPPITAQKLCCFRC